MTLWSNRVTYCEIALVIAGTVPWQAP